MITTPIATKKDAVLFIASLSNEGRSFHFDDSADTVIKGNTNEPLFTNDELPIVIAAVNKCFELLEDPFEVILLADAIADKYSDAEYELAEIEQRTLDSFYE